MEKKIYCGNDQKIENVMDLPISERYDYFIRKVADFEQIWMLEDDKGFALTKDMKGTEILPVWPEEDFVQICSREEWYGYRPVAISIYDFEQRLVPILTSDGVLLSVFFTPEGEGTLRSPSDLAADIAEECEQYN